MEISIGSGFMGMVQGLKKSLGKGSGQSLRDGLGKVWEKF